MSQGSRDAQMDSDDQAWALANEIDVLRKMGPHQNIISVKGCAIAYRGNTTQSHTFGILLEEMAGGTMLGILR